MSASERPEPWPASPTKAHEHSPADEPLRSQNALSSEDAQGQAATKIPGWLSFMAQNSVAANLFMLLLLVGGLLVGMRLKQEVFPDSELDTVTISVLYPGASPEEIEKGIILATEEAVRGLDGVKEVSALASEGLGRVYAELELDADSDKALNDIKNAVDRISSFPEDAERPVINLGTSRRNCLDIYVHGAVGEALLRSIAEDLREALLNAPGVTQVELSGVRPREVAIEISQDQLRRYKLNLEEIALRVRRAAIELPGGSVKTGDGEILLRTTERRELAREFEDLPLLTAADGTRVRLGEVARITDGFQEIDEKAFFKARPAVQVQVFRVGAQTPTSVSTATMAVLAKFKEQLPPGIGVDVWEDQSIIYRERVDLLLRNAAQGLVLVLFILGLFLDIRLAFWVTLGIPVSFLGSFLVLPILGVSINMISLFAYIITLGMVVDDAIVVGENIFERRQRGEHPLYAAIAGVREVAAPVTFSILTTVAAFFPMMFLPGFTGKIFRVIPAVVISVLLISLLESMFVLPAHLAHSKKEKGFVLRLIDFVPGIVGRGLELFVVKLYQPLLRAAVEWRYSTIALGFSVLMITVGFVASGKIEITFMPKIESDLVTADIEMPFGINPKRTEDVQVTLVKSASEVIEELGGDRIAGGIATRLGAQLGRPGRGPTAKVQSGGHIGSVQVQLAPAGVRGFSAFEFAERWRQRVGTIPGVKTLAFSAETGPSGGKAVEVQLSHRKVEVLEESARRLAGMMREIAGVKDVDEGFAAGKPQVDMKIKPAAEALGLSATELGRQVRSAFYGIEALRQQRGRDEVRVMVRFPEEDRRSEFRLETLVIRSPRGGEVPLAEAAELRRGVSETAILRVDGRRSIRVSADVIKGALTADKLKEALASGPLPELLSQTPGLSFSFEGDDRKRNEALEVLKIGMVFALLAIYGLLAIPFRSYVQPAIVMSAIPFGIVGAVVGHAMLGYEISIISMMGIVALTGVVVNDSLVLIDAYNSFRSEGDSAVEAIVRAGIRRFRPILLTSLTTFFGLLPMLTETSLQARFLIPMAIALGFGVLFSTVIVLLLVPALTIIVEDFLWIYGFDGPPQPRLDLQDPQPEAPSKFPIEARAPA